MILTLCIVILEFFFFLGLAPLQLSFQAPQPNSPTRLDTWSSPDSATCKSARVEPVTRLRSPSCTSSLSSPTGHRLQAVKVSETLPLSPKPLSERKMNYNLPVPGLPTPLRCLTFNASGQITVINVDKEGDPIVRVLREADADPSKGVVAASLDSKRHKLAVARKDGTVDLLNPHTGDVYCHNILVSDIQCGEGDIVGLHIRANYSTKRSCNIITCTTKGRVRILSLNQDGSHKKRNEWNVNSQGRTHFCQMDATEDYFVFGESPDALSVWKVEECIWKLEDPKNKCVRETFFTCATFMEDNEETLVAGNNMHEVVVYDTKCWMGNPELKVTFWEEENLEYWVPITAIANDLSGTKVYIGNDSGDLASVDISSGRVIKCFENLKRWPHKDSQTRKVSKSPIQKNSIKFIARDTQHPLISSSLDSHLHFWNEDSGKLLSTVYPMQISQL